MVHYNSVINITNGLLSLNNSADHKEMKALMIQYFVELEDKDYILSDYESLNIYKDKLLPMGQHLIKYKGFRTKLDFIRYFILGIVIDSLIFIIFKRFFMFGTITMLILGRYRQKQKIKNGKIFNLHW